MAETKEPKQIKLTEDEIVESLEILGVKQETTYKNGERAGQPYEYYRARFQGKIITLPAEVAEQVLNSELRTITFEETSYESVDSTTGEVVKNDAGEPVMRQGWQMIAKSTFGQIENMLANKSRLAVLKEDGMAIARAQLTGRSAVVAAPAGEVEHV